jgi:protein gp37
VKGATDIRLHPDRLDQPLRWRRPRRVFVNSLSDLFHEAIPDTFVASVFNVMANAERHTFQILTKRPDRMRAFILERKRRHEQQFGSYEPEPWIWLGTSVENQHFAEERIPILLEIPAGVRFISAEPLLGPLRLTPWLKLFRNDHVIDPTGVAYNRLDWVITGGESGPGARTCDTDWIAAIVEQCRLEGVACFVKQLGARIRWGRLGGDSGSAMESRVAGGILDAKGGEISEWPSALQVREYPC